MTTPTTRQQPAPPRSGCLVSVLTPSYGYGRFIADAVDSVLRQDLSGVEHIVQDGDSHDNTRSILESYGNGLRWCSEPDMGQSDALNRAKAHASGQWLAWLNADEFYLPGALSALVAHARKTGADVVYGDSVYVDEDGAFLKLVPQHRFSKRTLRSWGPFIQSCCVIFRRDIVGAGWDNHLRRIMDWDLYLRLADQGVRFSHLSRPCGAFRLHDARVAAAPAIGYLHEYELVARRFGLRSGTGARHLGRVLHGLLKLRDGAYLGELRARSYAGLDFAWMRSDEARVVVAQFVNEFSRFPGSPE